MRAPRCRVVGVNAKPVERCLASSVVRLSRTKEDKCEANPVGTVDRFSCSWLGNSRISATSYPPSDKARDYPSR